MKRALQSLFHDSAVGEVGAEVAAGALRRVECAGEIAIDNDVGFSDPRSRDRSRPDRACGFDGVPAFADDIAFAKAPQRLIERLGIFWAARNVSVMVSPAPHPASGPPSPRERAAASALSLGERVPRSGG